MSGNGITSSGDATSGYRVAMVSGALEVSARLATAEELNLLLRVLEANKILWTNSVTSEPNLLSRKLLDELPSQVAAGKEGLGNFGALGDHAGLDLGENGSVIPRPKATSRT